MIPKTDKLCQKLGYVFKDTNLLKAALSHRSVRGINNERLEFLGDSIINLVIAAALYHKCPDAKEGELSRLRASLVRGETLAVLAKEFALGDYLHLGAGELKSGGMRRLSILADAMEAMVGAIYLDAGMEVCQDRILSWYKARLETITLETGEKDPKTRLQECLQAKKMALPLYRVLSVSGKAHQQIFQVECQIPTLPHVTIGQGSTRRGAEQEAAQKLLEILESARI